VNRRSEPPRPLSVANTLGPMSSRKVRYARGWALPADDLSQPVATHPSGAHRIPRLRQAPDDRAAPDRHRIAARSAKTACPTRTGDLFSCAGKWSSEPLRKRANRATARFLKPSAGLEPATPSLPWRYRSVQNRFIYRDFLRESVAAIVRILRRSSRMMFPACSPRYFGRCLRQDQTPFGELVPRASTGPVRRPALGRL
jgi:hypothetical protein